MLNNIVKILSACFLFIIVPVFSNQSEQFQNGVSDKLPADGVAESYAVEVSLIAKKEPIPLRLLLGQLSMKNIIAHTPVFGVDGRNLSKAIVPAEGGCLYMKKQSMVLNEK